MHAAAVQTRLELLIRRQVGNVHNRIRPVRPVGAIPARARRRTGHQAAVIAPVEADPRSPLSDLILQVGGLN